MYVGLCGCCFLFGQYEYLFKFCAGVLKNETPKSRYNSCKTMTVSPINFYSSIKNTDYRFGNNPPPVASLMRQV